MDVRRIWWLAIAVGMTGPVLADDPEPEAVLIPATAAPRPPKGMPPARLDADGPPIETKQAPAAESSAVTGELDQDKLMAAQKAGFEIRNENGETLLCRKEPKTGSRLRHTVSCLTPKQWDQLQSDTAAALRAAERRRVGPNNK